MTAWQGGPSVRRCVWPGDWASAASISSISRASMSVATALSRSWARASSSCASMSVSISATSFSIRVSKGEVRSSASIPSAICRRASGLLKSCETPASRVLWFSRRAASWAAVWLKICASSASSCSPDSCSRGGCSPLPIRRAACARRATGAVIRRASNQAVIRVTSRPAATLQARAKEGRGTISSLAKLNRNTWRAMGISA